MDWLAAEAATKILLEFAISARPWDSQRIWLRVAALKQAMTSQFGKVWLLPLIHAALVCYPHLEVEAFGKLRVKPTRLGFIFQEGLDVPKCSVTPHERRLHTIPIRHWVVPAVKAYCCMYFANTLWYIDPLKIYTPFSNQNAPGGALNTLPVRSRPFS